MKKHLHKRTFDLTLVYSPTGRKVVNNVKKTVDKMKLINTGTVLIIAAAKKEIKQNLRITTNYCAISVGIKQLFINRYHYRYLK